MNNKHKLKISRVSKIVVIIYLIYCIFSIRNAINQIGLFQFVIVILFGCVFFAAISELLVFFFRKLTININNMNQTKTKPKKTEKTLVTIIKTKVVGVTFSCALNNYEKRQDVLECLTNKSKLHIEPFTYKGDPANYVVWKDTDIGCLKADLSKELFKKYNDCVYEVNILEITGAEPGKSTLGCNIAIYIYRYIDIN